MIWLVSEHVDEAKFFKMGSSHWHVVRKALPTVPDDWLPGVVSPRCVVLSQSQDDVQLGNLAHREFMAWAEDMATNAKDARSVIAHLLPPKEFKGFWMVKQDNNVKSKKRSHEADIDDEPGDKVNESEEADLQAKRTKLFQEAKDLKLLPHSYDISAKIKHKVVGLKAEVIAHVLAKQQLDSGCALALADGACWPKDALQISVPRRLTAKAMVAMTENGKAPIVRHVLPREIFTMKGYKADCLNHSTCTDTHAFVMCRNLPYKPVIRSWVLAALSSAGKKD